MSRFGLKNLFFSAVLLSTVVCGKSFADDISGGWNGGAVTVSDGVSHISGSGSQVRMSRRSFPVAPGKRYRISGEFKSDNPGNGVVCYGLAPVDSRGRLIYSVHVNALRGTDTELLADAAAGATQIQVKDTSKWQKGSTFAVAFGSKSDFSDLPNFDIVQIASIEGNTVTLKRPLRKAWAKGTALRQHSYGNTYIFAGANYKKASSQWSTFESEIAGENPLGSNGNLFWRGTAKVYLVIMTNCPELDFRNLKFEEIPETAAPAAAASYNANIVNARDFGAVGDGVADDTAAIQKAIDAALASGGGELFIPAGKYRITSTLFLRRARILRMYGQGDSVYNAKSTRATTLFWDGPDGGTLIRAEGFGNVYFECFNLAGRAENKPKSSGEAGILFHSISLPGYGSGWSTFRNVSLHKAKIGFVMGGDDSVDMCNSDMQFYSIGMYELETGFQTRNTQALNYIFSYINAANCGTVLDFKAGGNLEVHNATLSVCDRYLNIEMGGRCIGTYVNINVRLENRSKQRTVLVRSYPSYCQANIKFIAFDDSQVGWPDNHTPTRAIPLCDIGPGSCVTIESSIFNGVVADIKGTADAPASLILRECSFGWLAPENSISANEYGYFRIINPMNDHMRPLPDLFKWPAMDSKTFPANGTHRAVF